MPSQSPESLRVPGLNPRFLARHSILVLDRDGETLTVAMAEPTDAEALAALRFATGRDVRAVPLVPDRSEESAELPQHESEKAAGEPLVLTHEDLIDIGDPASTEDGAHPVPSFFERFLDWIGGGRSDMLGLVSLAALLEVGFSPSEAGKMLLGGQSGRAINSEAKRDIARQLAEGEPLDRVLSAASSVPGWFSNAVAAAPSVEAQATALERLVRLDDEFNARFDHARMTIVEIIMIWSVVIAAWAHQSWTAATMAALAGAWFAQRLRPLGSRTHANDLVRAHVLKLTAVLARLKIAPRPAIRCGFARLAEFSPTWGSLPDTREELADALDLPPVDKLLFLRDDLSSAAARAADDCERRAGASLERLRWVARCSAVGLFALAIATAALQ